MRIVQDQPVQKFGELGHFQDQIFLNKLEEPFRHVDIPQLELHHNIWELMVLIRVRHTTKAAFPMPVWLGLVGQPNEWCEAVYTYRGCGTPWSLSTHCQRWCEGDHQCPFGIPAKNTISLSWLEEENAYSQFCDIGLSQMDEFASQWSRFWSQKQVRYLASQHSWRWQHHRWWQPPFRSRWSGIWDNIIWESDTNKHKVED